MKTALGAPGNLVYFLGRNSSGKTSVLRSICHFEHAEVSEGDGDGGVPQQLLNKFRVDVPLEQEGCTGVAQAMERYLRQSCLLQERCEAPPAQIGRVDRRPSFGGEDEALVVVEILKCH